MAAADALNLKAQLAVVEARIKRLRTARAQVTYDLEWAVREAERLRRHIEAAPRRRRTSSPRSG